MVAQPAPHSGVVLQKDVANRLLQNDKWDESKLFDPLSLPLLIPAFLPPDLPFAIGLPLAIDIPINDKGKGLYIDDCLFAIPNLGNNLVPAAKAVPLAILCVAHPLDLEPSIPRKPIISEKKLSSLFSSGTED